MVSLDIGEKSWADHYWGRDDFARPQPKTVDFRTDAISVSRARRSVLASYQISPLIQPDQADGLLARVPKRGCEQEQAPI